MQKIILTPEISVPDLKNQDKSVIWGIMMISIIGLANLCGVIFMTNIS